MKTTRLLLSVAILATCNTQGALALNYVTAAEAAVGAATASQYYEHASENSDNVCKALCHSSSKDRNTLNKTNMSLFFRVVGAYANVYLNDYGTKAGSFLNTPAKYLAKLALASLASTRLLKASKMPVAPKNGQAPKCHPKSFALQSALKAAVASTMSYACFTYAYNPFSTVIHDYVQLPAEGNKELCKDSVILIGNELVHALRQYFKKQGCETNEIEIDGYLAPIRPAQNKQVTKPA